MIEFYLYHGRKTANEDMDDWGTEGPTLKGIVKIIDTYECNMRLFFDTIESATEAQKLTGWIFWDKQILQVPPLEGGCINANDTFYGDWVFEITDQQSNANPLEGSTIC